MLELKEGLDKLSIYRDDNTLLNFMRRYELSRNGSLNYEEFETMLMPQRTSYITMIKNRKIDAFCSETINLLKNFILIIIDNETKIQEIRKYHLNLFVADIFKSLDSKGKGYLSYDDVLFLSICRFMS